MSHRVRSLSAAALSVFGLAVGGVLVADPGQASAEVASGSYTSTTLSSGVVLLARPARVEGGDLVLIGRYPIHPTARGGYVDLFPGHRVILDRDGRGGYAGPAYWNGVRIGSITLTPRR